MDPSFQQWLTDRKVPPKVLKTLRHEDVTNRHTLRAMNESDLQELAKKHKLPMGHLVILRSARDELSDTLVAGGQERQERRNSFEEISHTAEGPVERETNQKEATTVQIRPAPDQSKKKSRWRQRGDEIKEKYQLPARSDRYSRAHGSRNGASAVASASATPPLPDHTRRPTSRASGLQVYTM